MTNKNKIIALSVLVIATIISVVIYTSSDIYQSFQIYKEFNATTAVMESPVAVKHIVQARSKGFYGVREKYWRQSIYTITKSETRIDKKEMTDLDTLTVKAEIKIWADEKTGFTPIDEPDVLILQTCIISRTPNGTWLITGLKEDWVKLTP